MSMKEKVLIVWLPAVVAGSFVFHHFWASTAEALGRPVASTAVSLLDLAKLAAGMCGVHLLP